MNVNINLMVENLIQIKNGITTNFGAGIKKKHKDSYILLTFVLIAIALLVAISIYFFLIKYKAKQKHLLPYYVTNDKLINTLQKWIAVMN